MNKVRIQRLIMGSIILISTILLTAYEIDIDLTTSKNRNEVKSIKHQEFITLFMCGDVMLGRGIDQILAHPSKPEIHESYIKDSRGYIRIAEQLNGPINYPVTDDYIWGYALDVFNRIDPDLKIINLEMSITECDDYWINKGINYRMHPKNIGSITCAKIDVCALANNHAIDWGYAGLDENIKLLKSNDIAYAGAGMNISEVERPAIFDIEGKGRVLLFSSGHRSSGIPIAWAASEQKAGLNLLTSFSNDEVQKIKQQIESVKQERDIVVYSIHWGRNWGYEIPASHINFAHQLIDQAGVDVIHGHSSHHFKGIEVYKGKPIIYGCGDFINDYEGIRGYESFRDDLVLMYFARIDPGSEVLVEFQMVPVQIKKFRLNRVTKSDAVWIAKILNREGEQFNTSVVLNKDNSLTLRWN